MEQAMSLQIRDALEKLRNKRATLPLEDFGVPEMRKPFFISTIVEHFQKRYTVDKIKVIEIEELLLHPREALDFCDSVRRTVFTGGWNIPDDVILRVVLDYVREERAKPAPKPETYGHGPVDHWHPDRRAEYYREEAKKREAAAAQADAQ
jgi:hypothetical protein